MTAVPMDLCALTVFLFAWIQLVEPADDSRFLQHRSGSHYFVRLNSKLSIFNYTTIFEYAAGYRINWDVKPFDEIRSLDERRRQVHRSIESELLRHGLDGQACLYRMFCEIESIQSQGDVLSRILKFVFRSQHAYTCPDTPACDVPIAWIPYMLYQN